jgi:hypothetical protein
MNSWQLNLLLGDGFAFGHGRTAKIDPFLSPFFGSTRLSSHIALIF